MPSFCMVLGCGSNAARDGHIRFFRIPSERTQGRRICESSKQRRESWIAALQRGDLNDSKIKYGRICSLHFHSGQPADRDDVENPDWIPSINMGHTSLEVKAIKHCKEVEI